MSFVLTVIVAIDLAKSFGRGDAARHRRGAPAAGLRPDPRVRRVGVLRPARQLRPAVVQRADARLVAVTAVHPAGARIPCHVSVPGTETWIRALFRAWFCAVPAHFARSACGF